MRRLLSGVIAASALAIMAVDSSLWQVAHLDQRILGKATGVAAMWDSEIDTLVRPELRKRELENKLQKAQTVEDYNKIYDELLRHLGEMGDTAGQFVLRRQALERWGTTRDKRVISACEEWLKRCEAMNDLAGAIGFLSQLRSIAEVPPPDIKMLANVAKRAERLQNLDFAAEVAEKALRLPGLNTEIAIDLLNTLSRIYARLQRHGRLQEVQALLAQYRGQEDKEKAAKRVIKELKEALTQQGVEFALAEFARRKEELAKVAELGDFLLTIIDAASRQEKNAPALRKAWEEMASLPPPPPDNAKAHEEIEAAAIASVQRLLADKREDDFRYVFEAAKRLTALPELKKFAEAELWARGNRQGDPPKPLYVIARRLQAKVNIDGNLDEEVYTSVKPLPAPWWVTEENSNTVPAREEETPDARIFYTETDLYIGARVPYSAARGLRRTFPKGTHSAVYQDDCLEFFIEPGRQLGEYFQWVASAGGAWYHWHLGPGRYHNGLYQMGASLPVDKKPEQMAAAAVVGDREYTLELRIPLSHFPHPPQLSGMLVNGNLRRFDYDPRAARPFPRIISWSNLRLPNHQSNYFNFFQFE